MLFCLFFKNETIYYLTKKHSFDSNSLLNKELYLNHFKKALSCLFSHRYILYVNWGINIALGCLLFTVGK